MHQAPVEEQQLISFFFRANINVLRTDDPILELGEPVSNFLYIIDNLGLLVRLATNEQPAHNVGLHMEVLAACDRVHPNNGKL